MTKRTGATGEVVGRVIAGGPAVAVGVGDAIAGWGVASPAASTVGVAEGVSFSPNGVGGVATWAPAPGNSVGAGTAVPAETTVVGGSVVGLGVGVGVAGGSVAVGMAVA